MEIDKTSIIPLYFQLADVLREKVTTKVLKPGDILPSESELIDKFGISRGTVRQAMQILTQEGLIERYPGKGSFVSHPKIEHDAGKVLGFFSQITREVGKRPSAKILEIKQSHPSKFVRSKLHLNEGEPIVLVKRLRFVDDEPWAIETAHFRNDIGGKLLNEDLSGSIYKLIQEKYGYIFYRSQNSIEASIACEVTANLLSIEVGRPVLYIKRLVFLSDDSPFEYSEDIYRADRIRFIVEDKYQEEDAKVKIGFNSTKNRNASGLMRPIPHIEA